MKKRFFQLVLTAVLSVSCVATGVNVSAAPLSSEGYSIEKVSHPERGAGETDGILSFDAMGEESNRNQSYVWSCVEHVIISTLAPAGIQSQVFTTAISRTI